MVSQRSHDARKRWGWLVLALAMLPPGAARPARAAGGRLELTVVDAETKQPLACRVHLRNPSDVPHRPKRMPFFHDHFACPGQVKLDLRRGGYTFEIERGPEYPVVSGHFTIEDFADDKKTVELRRVVDMAIEGWWSGDLHVHRPLGEIERLMQSEDLHLAPVITWWNDQNAWAKKKKLPSADWVTFDENRAYNPLAGEDERGGGALLYFGLSEPLPLAGSAREFPSPLHFARLAKAQSPGVWIDAEKPFWWDFPTWVASGLVDSVGLVNNHQQRGEVLDNEAWGRPRDRRELPGRSGNALWSQTIYYHLLNCGIRLPPSAGSASGVLPNPVGFNRVYVFLPGEFSPQAWWEGLRAGRVMVTNGPLLRPRVADQRPGHVFTASAYRPLSLQMELELATRDKDGYLELVRDGEIVHSVRLDEWVKQGASLPILEFKESGWFLARVTHTLENSFRIGSTGPYFVEVDGQKRISRASVQFFVDWVERRIAELKKTVTDPEQQEQVLADHLQARAFWRKKLAEANAD